MLLFWQLVVSSIKRYNASQIADKQKPKSSSIVNVRALNRIEQAIFPTISEMETRFISTNNEAIGLYDFFPLAGQMRVGVVTYDILPVLNAVLNDRKISML